jgi:hypothetical protein
MPTQIVRVRQTGMRTIRVKRDIVVEVPCHISKSPQLLAAWIDEREQGGDALELWYPAGTPHLIALETEVVGHATRADVPMTPEELALYDAGDDG